MRPFLFNIGSLEVPSFFFMILVGTFLMTFYCFFIASRVGLRRDLCLDIAMVCLIAGVLGSRLFHIFVEEPGYYWKHPMQVLEFWRGGFVSFGTIIAMPLAAVLYLKIRGVAVWPYLDLMALGAPLLQLSIRSACLLVGCCYGKPSDLPWAITFTNPQSAVYYLHPGTALHPTQIYSMIHAILLFIFGNVYYFKKKNRVPGEFISVMLLGYFIPRFIIEFWRGDTDRGLWFGGLLSTGQIVGLVGSVICLFLLLYLKRQPKQSNMT